MPTLPEVLLAVDGGGTKTQAVVADLEGKVLARGLAPSSTVHNVGFEESCQALTTAIEGALVNVLGPQARGEGPVWRSARIAAACFGLAGIDSPQTADGRAAAKALLDAVVRHWSLPDAVALIRHVHADTMTPSEIAGLASVVLDLSARGDADAKAIVEEAATDLARHVQAVVRKLGMSKPPLALSGGLLRASLRQAVLAKIGGEVGPVNYVTDPPLGGVVLARRLLKR